MICRFLSDGNGKVDGVGTSFVNLMSVVAYGTGLSSRLPANSISLIF